MSLLQGKKILLGISGGIAAYKMNFLVRDLIKLGAEVQVILTPAAESFVSKLTLSTLSQKPVYTDFYTKDEVWINHVELALWADLILLAPCTANTLAKMVNGLCDNLLLAIYMSAKSPVIIAPAMDLDMYQHPSTLQNLEKAEDFGHLIIPAEFGELASGLEGQGRLAHNDHIIEALSNFYHSKQSLHGKTVLITAGPTYEAIDPVRFIGNHSSGKMGFALAEEAAARGAKVILISGPSNLEIKNEKVELHRVTSANEMKSKVFEFYDTVDIAIASAAVADYAPKNIAAQKIKKSEDIMMLELVKNPDILWEMGQKKSAQYLLGFALETQNEETNAKLKLQKKNLDAIILNSLNDAGAGFQGDTNKIKIISKTDTVDFGVKSKKAVAKDLLDFIERDILK